MADGDHARGRAPRRSSRRESNCVRSAWSRTGRCMKRTRRRSATIGVTSPVPTEAWVASLSRSVIRSLWFIAWDGDQIAGYSLCRFRMGIGWVGTLGVRRAWRKRGLGEALLLHSFAEFYKRDMKVIGLGVDAANPTGATRLYQKAGMKIAAEYVIYEKELRPGRDPEEQEGE
ncbi:MAG: GNAT family N-acetyltransferase [Marinilabiliales bacterium]|nr:GNAT family N-acetyltransferase [Marinilabiliales bacterium]